MSFAIFSASKTLQGLHPFRKNLCTIFFFWDRRINVIFSGKGPTRSGTRRSCWPRGCACTPQLRGSPGWRRRRHSNQCPHSVASADRRKVTRSPVFASYKKTGSDIKWMATGITAMFSIHAIFHFSPASFTVLIASFNCRIADLTFGSRPIDIRFTSASKCFRI